MMIKIVIVALFVAVCAAADWKDDFELYEAALKGKEKFNDLVCYNCTITWDTYTMEYVDCVMYDECPKELKKKTKTTHDPERTYSIVNWRFTMKKNPPEKILKVGVNELHWDMDIDMGVGDGDIADCDECIGLYLDYKGEKSIYNYCMIIDCPAYFTGNIDWNLVRPQVHQELMDVTSFDVPCVSGNITHAHSYLDWSKTPLLAELEKKK
ncbi:uncharacterized protein LOC144432759 [Glandiceps talaboti]